MFLVQIWFHRGSLVSQKKDANFELERIFVFSYVFWKSIAVQPGLEQTPPLCVLKKKS